LYLPVFSAILLFDAVLWQLASPLLWQSEAGQPVFYALAPDDFGNPHW